MTYGPHSRAYHLQKFIYKVNKKSLTSLLPICISVSHETLVTKEKQMSGNNPYEEYNGFINRETWAFKLWITNSQELLKEAEQRIADQEAGYAAESLREWLVEMWDDCMHQSGYYGTGYNFKDTLFMLQDIGSAWRIAYYQVADALIQIREAEQE